MKKTKEIKLYNVMFSVWLLFLFPVSWLLILPANFIIDSVVLLVALWAIKSENIKETYKKTILYVFLFGFLSDFVGGLLLLLTQFMGDSGWIYEFIVAPVAANPFDNVYALFYTILAVVVSGILIYVFNRFVSFRKLENNRTKKILALTLALVTAPYLFLLPTSSVYGGSTEVFANHFVWDEYIRAELYIGDEETDILADEEYNEYAIVSAFREGINNAEKTSDKNTGKLKYSIVFETESQKSRKMDKIQIYENNQKLYFEWKNKVYKMKNEDVQLIYKSMIELSNRPDVEVK